MPTWEDTLAPCGHSGTTWQIRVNLCLLRPTRMHSTNGKWIGSAVSAQLPPESPYALQWVPLFPKIAPSFVGSEPLYKSWFLGPVRADNPNGITIGSAVFAPVIAECLYFTMGHPFSPQNCPFPWGSGPQSNTWFPGPTRVVNLNGISVGSAVYAGLTSVTDRPTWSVTIDRIYIRSTGDAV